ncbi:Haloalkane dehalogenase [Sedimentisphaera cyanobacteriorum]|uniref:Haloalkane dehalogenase n=1 Tax=Sedimentisphaera cyanobacteriorum TaxID=1940790 RepID=A0A1Q2HNQ1_9BACT|nr:haloalkane dehalogenase [Sedimentisphaera cyanobacteriorum]AQQ09098.1 Haloalkane dehalogenase [Sedimentisphaera cyanobacteriorum]
MKLIDLRHCIFFIFIWLYFGLCIDISVGGYAALETPDISKDGKINLIDLSIMAEKWLSQDCFEPDWCQGTDINHSGDVSFADIEFLATYWAGNDYTKAVMVGNTQRRYWVHLPPEYDSNQPTAVVVAFHGGGGNPQSMMTLSGLNEKSDEEGFIVVYPYGSGIDPNQSLSFNGGNCCSYAMQNNINDIAFVDALLDDLSETVNVDPNRIYATGFSNGSIMTYLAASELSERFAAVAPVGGPMGTETCNPSRPVPIIHFHGTSDQFAPFNGGYGTNPVGGPGVTDFYSVDHSIQNWVRTNGCDPDPDAVPMPNIEDDGTFVVRKTYSSGLQGSEVLLYVIMGGGHTWPGREPTVNFLGKSTKDISANDLMWEFFQKHPKKPSAGMPYLRTPESRFDSLPGYDFTSNYFMVDDYEGGQLRMHYIDEGPKAAPTILMLHGNPTWTYQFREIIPILNEAGYRTILVDYIGMGRSDKPTVFGDYTYDRHVGWVKQMFDHLDSTLNLGQVVIFGHDYGTPIGIRLMAEHYPNRFDAFIDANASLPEGDNISPTHLNWRQFVRENPDVPVGHIISSQVNPPLSPEEIAAYDAPYPNVTYKTAIRSFPEMVPETPEEPEAAANIAAWTFMESFTRPFMTIFGSYDLVGGPNARREFIKRVPGAYGQPHPQLDVTHYAPEDKPEAVAEEVIQFLDDVYQPTAFTKLHYSEFEEDFDGFADGGANCFYDPIKKAVKLTGNSGIESSTWQVNSMDLTDKNAVKIAFRYLPFDINDTEEFIVEFWNGSNWIDVLNHTAGVDFQNGAQDYGFVRIENHEQTFTSDSRIRIRCCSRNASAGIYLLDIGIYARDSVANQ